MLYDGASVDGRSVGGASQYTMQSNATDRTDLTTASTASVINQKYQEMKNLIKRGDLNGVNALLGAFNAMPDLPAQRKQKGLDRFFFHAVKAGKVAIADRFIEEGANVDAEHEHDQKVCTTLLMAAREHSLEAVEYLLSKRANPNQLDRIHGKYLEPGDKDVRRSPLHYAVNHDSQKMASVLLSKDANCNLQDSDGCSPLHVAVNAKKHEMVRFFLGLEGVDVNLGHKKGWSPLHFAALAGDTVSVELLLGAHANINAQAQDRATPLHMAARSGHVEVVALLLQKGADKTLVDKKHRTPLDLTKNEKVKQLLQGKMSPTVVPDNDESIAAKVSEVPTTSQGPSSKAVIAIPFGLRDWAGEAYVTQHLKVWFFLYNRVITNQLYQAAVMARDAWDRLSAPGEGEALVEEKKTSDFLNRFALLVTLAGQRKGDLPVATHMTGQEGGALMPFLKKVMSNATQKPLARLSEHLLTISDTPSARVLIRGVVPVLEGYAAQIIGEPWVSVRETIRASIWTLKGFLGATKPSGDDLAVALKSFGCVALSHELEKLAYTDTKLLKAVFKDETASANVDTGGGAKPQ